MPSGKNKHRVKGKAISLSSFLAADAPSGFAAVDTGYNWGDVMENIPVDDKFTISKKELEFKDSKIYLPTAPKAARGPDVDMSRVPTEPPFRAYLGNLAYDVLDEDIIKFFRELKVVSVSFPKEDGERGRMKGFGYVEFADQQSLLEALTLDGESLHKRTIQVKLAGTEENEKDHDYRNSRRGRSDRTTGNWRATGRDEGFSRDYRDDRQRNDTWYKRNDRGDRGGYGGRRENDSRDDSDWRRGDRSGFRRDDRGYDRRYRGDYERRDYENRERNAPKERTKLQIKPRSVPIEQQDSNSFGSASIFGGAKPVDTTKKEREIEQRILQEKDILQQEVRRYSKDDQHCSSSSTFSERVENAEEYGLGAKRTKENYKNTGPSQSTEFDSEKSIDTETRERQTEEPLAKERQQESGKQFTDLARHSSGARFPSPSSSGRHERRSSSIQEDDTSPWTESRRRTAYNRNYGSNNREKYYDRRNNYSHRYGKDDDDTDRGRHKQYSQSNARYDKRENILNRRQLERSQENDYDRRNNYSYRYGKDDDAERGRHRQYSQSNERNDRRDARRQLESNVQNAQKYKVPQPQKDKRPVYTSVNRFQHLMSGDDGNGSE